MPENYWVKLFEKLIDTFTSVKVLTMMFTCIISTILLFKGLVSGSDWTKINATVVSVVMALREGFKVTRVKDMNGNAKDIKI